MIATTHNHIIAISNWWRLVWMTMGQLLAHYGRIGGRFAFIMALLEPLLLIGAIYIIRALWKMGSVSYGPSLFLFLASGFLPFYIFIHISTRTRTAVGRRGGFPRLSALDIYIATILVNTVVWITMTVVIFFGMWLSGIAQARPASIVNCAVPLLLLIALAMGVGMINNVIGRYFVLWLLIYRIATRGLIFLSGLIFIVDLEPLWMRVWSIANPISHALTWFRLGVYGRYPHNFLDQGYLVEWALIALFLGFVLNRATIRSLDKG